jgi:ribonuclease PH
MSAEGSIFSRTQIDQLLDLAIKGSAELTKAQLAAVGA